MNLKIDSNILLSGDIENIFESVTQENTFENPRYLSNEKHGLSNWKVNRIIETYFYKDGCLAVPRGYLSRLMEIVIERNLLLNIEDIRVNQTVEYPPLKGITLRPYQEKAVEQAVVSHQGVIVSPTGSGKSIIGLEIIRRHKQKALIIVHRGELAKQWISIIQERLGITPGFIGDGAWTIGDEITIAMIQTLSAKQETKILSNDFGLILLDEAHHAPASTFFDVIGLFNARYRYGLSATPNRRDGLERMIYLSIGPTIAEIDKAEVESLGSTVPVKVVSIKTGFKPGLMNSWSDYIDSLTVNTDRNMIIIDLIKQCRGSTLILVDRVSHAQHLSDMLSLRKVSHVIAHGKLKKKERENMMERMKSAKLTIGTTSLLGEGLDVGDWSVLIMAAPISSEIKLLQAIGRVVRPSEGKELAVVYDLKDDCGFAGASFNKRMDVYKRKDIWVQFSK